jgi:hypothetical protein
MPVERTARSHSLARRRSLAALADEGERVKQSRDTHILFPRRQPRTLLAMQRWHEKLLRDCLFFEFKKKALEAALDTIRKEAGPYIAHVREQAGLERVAAAALEQLNRLKKELSDELAAAKEAVRMIHDTNEVIIANLVRARGGGELLTQLQGGEPALRSTNLLHGEGWLLEVLSANHLRQQGKVAFVTFGTMFDPAKFDVIAFDGPRRRVQWKMKWPSAQRRERKVRRLTTG